MGKRKAPATQPVKGGRKPSPVWTQWQKEVKSCRDFLRKLRLCTTMGGEKWRAKMKAHYTDRLKTLKVDEPVKFR